MEFELLTTYCPNEVIQNISQNSRYLLDPYPKITGDSLRTNISWFASESITILIRKLLITSWLLSLWVLTLSLSQNTLSVLSEAVSLQLQFLKPQMNSLLICSLLHCFLLDTSCSFQIAYISSQINLTKHNLPLLKKC